MTRGDFDETAARAAVERARERHVAATDAATCAYAVRRETKAALDEAEEHYALVMAFDGAPPSIGDPVPPREADGYPEGRIAAMRVVRGDSRTPTKATSVHLTIETSRGTYVARHLVAPSREVRA